MTPHRGVIILVVGILSLVMCPPAGIAAWFMGSKDLQEIDAGRMDPAGRDFTRTGRILGLIGTIYFVLWCLAVILFVIFRVVPFMNA